MLRLLAILGLTCVLAIALTGASTAVAAAEKTHGHEAIGEKGLNADPAHLSPDLAVYTGIVFLVVLLVLWKFAWGPICKALSAREVHIADNIAAAERQNLEARRLLGEHQKKLEGAQAEVREILEEARRDARHTQEEILAKAREEAQKERDRAIRDIDLATQAALKQLGEKSVNLAVQLAGKIVATNLSPDDHARLVSDAVNRFVQSAPSRN